MNCPKCKKEMQEGIMIVDAPQSMLRFITKTVGGLIWLDGKLENFSKWKRLDRKRLIPIALKRDDLKRGFICENCCISVIEYK